MNKLIGGNYYGAGNNSFRRGRGTFRGRGDRGGRPAFRGRGLRGIGRGNTFRERDSHMSTEENSYISTDENSHRSTEENTFRGRGKGFHRGRGGFRGGRGTFKGREIVGPFDAIQMLINSDTFQKIKLNSLRSDYSLVDTIRDAVAMGTLMMTHIRKIEDHRSQVENQISTKEDFISQMKSNDGYKYYFLLNLLKYLQTKGMKKIQIVKHFLSEDLEEIIQNYLITGIYSLHKITVVIEKDENKVKDILKNDNSEKVFIKDMRDFFSLALGLDKKQIIINNLFYAKCRNGIKFELILIEFTKEGIEQKKVSTDFIEETLKVNGFKVKSVKEKPIFDCIILSPELFSCFDKDYHYIYKGTNPREIKNVGGENYYVPPAGWEAIGLDISKYGLNNSWIEGPNSSQWPVAYHGVGKEGGIIKILSILKHGLKPGKRQAFKDIVNKVGVYLSPDINVCEKYGADTDLDFIPVFMCRIHPKHISKAKAGTADYWVIEGLSSILRPYKLLIKLKPHS